jgi:prepilin-type N-terminal cleavage/methylation domain-containing protein
VPQINGMSVMKSFINQRGFTLVEVLISLVIILTIVVFGLGSDMVLRNRLDTTIQNRYNALDLAHYQIEFLKVTAEEQYGDPGGPFDPAVGTHATTIMSGDIPVGFNVTYTVTDIDWPEDGAGDADCKRISVTCAYPTSSVTLDGYVVK